MIPSVAVSWPAPAKINLFLHITGRRADGYHELQTAFQFLDLCDRIEFSVREDGVIRRETEIEAVAAENDLIVRAAKLLQVEAGVSAGVDIGIEKVIPLGGGFGGGSSDAATTLAALNRLWGVNYDDKRLARLGLQLGADVPVFVHGQTAWAEGVGEVLQPIDWEEPWYLLVLPPVHVSTAEVFQAPDLTRFCPAITIRDLKAGRAGNVCEPVVRKRYPEVDQAMSWLSRHTGARMTGTGAGVFGRFNTKDEAESVRLEFQQSMSSAWRAIVCRGLNRSPLKDFVAEFTRG